MSKETKNLKEQEANRMKTTKYRKQELVCGNGVAGEEEAELQQNQVPMSTGSAIGAESSFTKIGKRRTKK